MREFVGFRVLEWFLVHPSGEVHLNELARELEISPASAKEYCDRLAEDGLISERAMGNLRLFRLNPHSAPLVQPVVIFAFSAQQSQNCSLRWT